MKEALKLGNNLTKRAVAQEALKEYVQRQKKFEVIELFGTIEYEDDYGYKKQRQKR